MGAIFAMTRPNDLHGVNYSIIVMHGMEIMPICQFWLHHQDFVQTSIKAASVL